MIFYTIIFSLLAVLLVVAGLTVISRRRNQLRAAENSVSSPTQTHGSTSEATRRKRKAERSQSRHDRRKRH
jgi:hypothetical protein